MNQRLYSIKCWKLLNPFWGTYNKGNGHSHDIPMQAELGCGNITPTHSQTGTKEVSGQYQLRPLFLWERTQYALYRMLGVPRDQPALCKVTRVQKSAQTWYIKPLRHFCVCKFLVEFFIFSDSCSTFQGSHLI